MPDEHSEVYQEQAFAGVLARIGRNFGVLAIGQIVAGIVLVATRAYLGNVLMATGLGAVTYPETILLFCMLFSNMGLDIVGVSEVARHPGREGFYAGQITILRLCLSLVALGTLCIFCQSASLTPQTTKLIILYGLALLPLAFSLEWVFHGVQKMQYHAALLILREAIFAVSIFLFVRSPADLLLIPVLHLISRIAGTLFLLAVFVKAFGRLRFKWDGDLGRGLLRQSRLIGLSQMLAVLIYIVGTWLLNAMTDKAQVGYYEAVAGPARLFLMLSGTFSSAIFPVASRLYKKSRTTLRHLISFAVKLSAVASAVVLLCGLTLSSVAVNILYPKGDYAASIPVLMVLSGALASATICNIYARALLACDGQKAYLVVVSIQVCVCLILSVSLIPRYGALGAACGPLGAEAIGITGYYLALRRALARSHATVGPKDGES